MGGSYEPLEPPWLWVCSVCIKGIKTIPRPLEFCLSPSSEIPGSVTANHYIPKKNLHPQNVYDFNSIWRFSSYYLWYHCLDIEYPERRKLKMLEKVPHPIVKTSSNVAVQQKSEAKYCRGPEPIHNKLIYGQYGVQV